MVLSPTCQLVTFHDFSQLCCSQVPGQVHSFIEHIQEGIAQAEADATALLLFSGGPTRKAAGPRSEAEGYWLVAEAADWWGHSHIRERAYTEVKSAYQRKTTSHSNYQPATCRLDISLCLSLMLCSSPRQ